MNENLSKYKGIIYCAALLIVLPTAIYLLALKKTVNTYIANKKVSSEIKKMEVAMPTGKPQEVSITSQDCISNGLIINYIKSSNEDQNSIVIDKFVPSKIDLGNGLFIHTAQITVYSDYISIVKAINHIEKTATQCNIVSVSFNSETERQTTNVKLKANIIIQQILEQ